MRPISPLSLLLFLRLTAAIPIPFENSSLRHQDCVHFACQSRLRELFSEWTGKKSFTVSRFANPEFPPHQLASPAPSRTQDLAEEEFDNTPRTPPKYVKPGHALSADGPLESSYLLSLSIPTKVPSLQNPPQREPREGDESTTNVALTAKPTSALPYLRKEDARKYWANLLKGVSLKESDLSGTVAGDWIATHTPKLAHENSHDKAMLRAYAQPVFMAREYSDFLIVGIVLLFLCAVVTAEAAENMFDVRSTLFSIRRPRRGPIFLEADEILYVVVKKPFYLQPAPPPKSKKMPHAAYYYSDSDSETQTGTLYHDKQTSEKADGSLI